MTNQRLMRRHLQLLIRDLREVIIAAETWARVRQECRPIDCEVARVALAMACDLLATLRLRYVDAVSVGRSMDQLATYLNTAK